MKAKAHRRRWLMAAPATLALASAAAASAADWQLHGGDTGRSGNQPVGDGGPPVRALYSKTDAADRGVVSSIVATTGAVGTQRLAYATANGRVHLRVLESGAPVGPDAGVDVDDGADDRDVFGPGPGAPAAASVSPVDTSTASGLGQLLVVHNDDDESSAGDISIAQVDVAGGGLVKQGAGRRDGGVLDPLLARCHGRGRRGQAGAVLRRGERRRRAPVPRTGGERGGTVRELRTGGRHRGRER